MSQQIEQLKHGTTLIFPRTSQEAVLVIYKNKVQTLGDYINRTVITPNESPQNIKIQYNKQGEIINTKPVEKLNIFINGKQYIGYDGNTEDNLNFGDDFISENNNIKLCTISSKYRIIQKLLNSENYIYYSKKNKSYYTFIGLLNAVLDRNN